MAATVTCCVICFALVKLHVSCHPFRPIRPVLLSYALRWFQCVGLTKPLLASLFHCTYGKYIYTQSDVYSRRNWRCPASSPSTLSWVLLYRENLKLIPVVAVDGAVFVYIVYGLPGTGRVRLLLDLLFWICGEYVDAPNGI